MTSVAKADSLVWWKHRIRHWYGMFAGQSYYHQPQGLGRRFIPHRLEGYFNDLTGKTQWHGLADPAGIPLSKLSNGLVTYLPVLLCQKALGHWDCSLMGDDGNHLHQFLSIANWLVDNQDQDGGWNSLGILGHPDRYRYSAMTQGEAVSVMVRAHLTNGEQKFERACRNALALMRRPVQEQGVCIYEGESVFLEEFPAERRDTVLNGWLFALFGLHDFLARFPDQPTEIFYRRCCDSLLRHLQTFDTGYWSYYSSGTHRLASPFYHSLHLSQLEALAAIADPHIIGPVRNRWRAYQHNRLYKTWAVGRKAVQKLREKPEITVIG
ncbi:MAG TPA: D-glucuronyl C5-epimerase family protein [Verrucomicrobiae bacterium]|nr:D-glucuronyl C5-epimerase family protein [Verrucomicrobiae bacterium]